MFTQSSNNLSQKLKINQKEVENLLEEKKKSNDVINTQNKKLQENKNILEKKSSRT